MDETEGGEITREELLRELTKAGEETAELELDSVITQSQIRFATYDKLRALGRHLNPTG
jgi:Ca2+-binding EF-hand superfamily protein